MIMHVFSNNHFTNATDLAKQKKIVALMGKSGLNFENERGVAGLGKETQISGLYNAR